MYMAIAVILIGVSFGFTSKVPFIILFAVGGLSNLLPIFMFKHRNLQMRILIFGAVVLLGLQGWMVYDYINAPDTVKFNYTMVVPVICAILDFLAIRGVIQDELLVRSSSRLRAAKRRK